MSESTRRSSSALVIVVMITLVLLINYVDRGSLSLAIAFVPFREFFKLDESQLGTLQSSFYWTYAVSNIVVGYFADRIGAHRTLAAGVLLWSLATLLMGFASSLLGLIVLRLLLGMGESVGFPCTSKILAAHVKPAYLGLANGVLAFGYLFGPAVGTYVGGHLLSSYNDWRPMFWLFGGVSLLWIVPWLFMRSDEPTVAADVAHSQSEPPTFRQVLRQRGLWGASLGHFTTNYTYYFILQWLPYYLVQSRGFSMAKMADVVSESYVINAIAAVTVGWLLDAAMRRHWSPTLLYKSAMGISHLGAIACMAGIALLPEQQSVWSLFMYQIMVGLSAPGVFAIPQLIAGEAAAGRWVGVQNFCGNLAGIVAGSLTGFLLAQFGHSFMGAFAVAGIINVLGFVGWVIILPSLKPIDWSKA
jgi:MFS family permease